MCDLNGPPASPSWAWSVTKFPHPQSRNGIMYNLPERPRQGRPPASKEPPLVSDVPADIRRAPEGNGCVYCGHDGCGGHPKVEQ